MTTFGRYVSLPLFPLSLGELLERRPSWDDFQRQAGKPARHSRRARPAFERLFEFGGFPEPYLRKDPRFLRIWRDSRRHLLVHEDIRDATNIRNLSQLEMLLHLLEPRLGSPLSINNLREDLEVAFDTVRGWLQVLSDFYLCWKLPPYSRKIARALRKEAKLYFYDWTEIEDPAVRFENLVALHLRKACGIWTALGEASPELYYVRDKEKREVNFLLVEGRKPQVLVECKASDKQLAPHLLFYQERLDVPLAIQLVLEKGHDEEYRRGGRQQRVLSADRWLGTLP